MSRRASCASPSEPTSPSLWDAAGCSIEYLDPSYRVTTIDPGSNLSVLRCGASKDAYVSRAHFMICQEGRSLRLVNGVPRRTGGIRAPRNGTVLLSPVERCLSPEETYLILPSERITILLPNGAVLSVGAQTGLG